MIIFCQIYPFKDFLIFFYNTQYNLKCFRLNTNPNSRFISFSQNFGFKFIKIFLEQCDVFWTSFWKFPNKMKSFNIFHSSQGRIWWRNFLGKTKNWAISILRIVIIYVFFLWKIINFIVSFIINSCIRLFL